MRDLVLMLTYFCLAPIGLFLPYVGLLVWGWISFMSPHRQVFGFGTLLPLNMIVAGITLLGLILYKERVRLYSDRTLWLMLAFGLWFLLTTLFALNGSAAWTYFDRHIKTLIFAILVLFLIDRRTRIHAFILLIVSCLAYYGIKGGGFVLLTGGTDRVWGPPQTEIADNNHLALALVLTLPLINYLRLNSRYLFLRLGLIAVFTLNSVAVIGSYSRGGLVGLAVVFFALFVKGRYKIVTVFVATLVVAVGVNFMPAEWETRMQTIRDPMSDESFRARIEAWGVAVQIAMDRPLVGAGFQAQQTAEVYYRYVPNAEKPRAAHSVYLQVLGEHGIVGLLLFLGILAAGITNARRIQTLTRRRADLVWAYDLAGMVQVSLVAFAVAGAALSMAYYDVVYVMVALMAATRKAVERQISGVTLAMASQPARFELPGTGPKPAVPGNVSELGRR
ncbi:MAG: putative O-glycosylation ligase, exosortase A system-associated [Alphaproteobacteria bacterium]|nr:putative O-glycosylation ligase, exosortase A system-associated [Alphaproteobacteria bacterium]